METSATLPHFIEQIRRNYGLEQQDTHNQGIALRRYTRFWKMPMKNKDIESDVLQVREQRRSSN